MTSALKEAFEALQLFREAFVVAVGDKSSFAKQALAQADKAAAIIQLEIEVRENPSGD